MQGNAAASCQSCVSRHVGLIRRIVDNLPPPGNYMRELCWKGQAPAIKSLLEARHKHRGAELAKAMAEMAIVDEQVAERQLKNIGVKPALRAQHQHSCGVSPRPEGQ